MPKVFISYRRADSETATGRLHDFLAAQLGRSNLFLDIDSIKAGDNFTQKIRVVLEQCDTVLVIIGPKWNPTNVDSKTDRLSDPKDWVRLEVSAALASSKKVIPVLIDSTTMPKSGLLPADIAPLTQLNAIRLRSGIDFPGDARRILTAIGHPWIRRLLLRSLVIIVLVSMVATTYQLFPNAYKNILHLRNTDSKFLSDGMFYPNVIDSTNPDLIENSRIIGDTYEIINSKPWRRKAVVVSDSAKRDIFQPRAAVIDSILHILFLSKAWDEPKLYLNELVPRYGELRVVDSLPYKEGTGYYFDDDSNMVISGQYIYYFHDESNTGRSYKIGSMQGAIDADFFRPRKGMFYTSTSPNGRFIAASFPSIINVNAPEDYELATLGEDSEQSYTGISLYDKKAGSSSLLFKQEYSGDWSIGSIIWSDDSDNIFFDNNGAVACVWKYNISQRILQKIIPEHQARSPFFFRLGGVDYIIYVETIGNGKKFVSSRLLLATE